MARTLTFLFTLLTIVACGKSGGGSSADSNGSKLRSNDVREASSVPSGALNFEVNLKLDNFSPKQEEKIQTAADLIKKVVASEEFRTAVLNHKYRGKKTFVDNEGLSNAEIYETIIEGSEELMPGEDNEMDLDLEVFNRSDDTVGYTFPDEVTVWMNARFINRNTPAKVTTNMMHEWLHKLGFRHAVSKTVSRPFSVPYAIGYIVARLAQKFH